MRILGLDPGFANTGWALFDVSSDGALSFVDGGVITTKKASKKTHVYASDDNMSRAASIFAELEAKLPDVSLVAYEAMSFVRSASSMAKIGMMYGALAGLLQAHGLAGVSFTPQGLKDLTAGRSSATKDEVESAVLSEFPGIATVRLPKSKRDHMFDAAAAVLASRQSDQFRILTKRG